MELPKDISVEMEQNNYVLSLHPSSGVFVLPFNTEIVPERNDILDHDQREMLTNLVSLSPLPL